MKKQTLSTAALIVLALGLVACHTMEGFGTDVQQTGSGIHNTAANTLNKENDQ